MTRGKKRLVLLVVTLAFALGVFEVALRISWRRTKPAGDHSWHVHDTTIGWRHKKSTTSHVDKNEALPNLPHAFDVTINANGLRDTRDFAPVPSSGVTRIACVGDSYTFGFLVQDDQPFPKRLESALGSGFEVMNWGVCAYGVDQSYLQLDEVLATKPRLVVLSVIDMNFRRATRANFLDGTAKPRFYLEGDELVLTNVPVPEVKAGETYCKNDVRGSYVFWGLARAFENMLVRLSKDPAAADERWILGRALIRAFQKKCKAAGVPMALVLLPEERLMSTGKNERSKSAEPNDPLSRLMPVFEAEGIPFLDLYPAFTKRASEGLFEPQDGHPSPAGHKVIAEELRPFLEARGLLR